MIIPVSTPTQTDLQPAGPAKKSNGAVRIGIALGAIVLVGLLVWQITKKPADADAKKGAGNRPIAVTVAPVERRDVPVTVEGLGSVTPLATVTMKAQVDGRLLDVTFKEGQPVKKGELLAQIDPRPFQIALEQAAAAKQRDEALARNANLNLERNRTLRQQNLIAQQQVDDQVAAAAQAQATVALDQAAIDSARLNLDYARVTSPVDGVTGIRQVDPGNIVHQADANGIVVITQLDPISVIFTLPQDALPDVSAAMADKQLEVDAYARDGQTLLSKGKLLLVDNQINAATATLRLKAVFDNPKHQLWPNQFVKARLYLTTHEGAMVVQAPAVQRGPNGTFVYVVGDDGLAHVRPVDVDSTNADIAILAKGVSEGEKVVTEGVAQLKDGAKVQIRGAEGEQKPAGGEQKKGGGKKHEQRTEVSPVEKPQ